jgi:nicotinamidase-related amidase
VSNAEATKPVPLPAVEAPREKAPGRHLVVVMTRAAKAEDQNPGAVLVTRFWHPRDRRWSQNFFESLDHAIRLFVDETGWTLVQQQHLTAEHEHELIFEARPQDFQGPSTEDILEEVGLTPADVTELLKNDR